MMVLPLCCGFLGYAIALGQDNARVGYLGMFFVAAGIYPTAVLHLS